MTASCLPERLSRRRRGKRSSSDASLERRRDRGRTYRIVATAADEAALDGDRQSRPGPSNTYQLDNAWYGWRGARTRGCTVGVVPETSAGVSLYPDECLVVPPPKARTLALPCQAGEPFAVVWP